MSAEGVCDRGVFGSSSTDLAAWRLRISASHVFSRVSCVHVWPREDRIPPPLLLIGSITYHIPTSFMSRGIWRIVLSLSVDQARHRRSVIESQRGISRLPRALVWRRVETVFGVPEVQCGRRGEGAGRGPRPNEKKRKSNA